MEQLIPPITDTVKCANPVNTRLAERHKAKGNKLFKSREFKGAVLSYTEALLSGGGTVWGILSNWALCALEIGANADVIAAATASICIAVDEKAFYRLLTSLAFLAGTMACHFNRSMHFRQNLSRNRSMDFVSKCDARLNCRLPSKIRLSLEKKYT
jgi:hypothetical protein